MPTYDFLCDDCGPFEERRPFEETADSAVCPACNGAARRLYSMPNTRRMPAALSGTMDRAEKSAYEPEVARRPVRGTGTREAHQHSHGRPWTLGH